QPQGADPELLLDRGHQRLVVHRLRRYLSHRQSEPSVRFGQQLLELLRQQRHLHLLEHHRHQPPPAAGLEVEGALARLADRAHDEPLRWFERVHLVGHTSTLPKEPAPAPPPTGASEAVLSVTSNRSSPVSLRR